MTQEHPITPPPLELVDEWDFECGLEKNAAMHIATRAARWGADQELKACYEWIVRDWTDIQSADMLLNARRPKPPSLKEQALLALSHLEKGAEPQMDATEAAYTIRRALESLPS